MTRAIAAVVAVVALAAGGIWLARPNGGGPDPREWEAKASAAFKPLVQDVPDLVRGAREWQNGDRPTDVFTSQVHTAVADFMRTRRSVTALQPSPKSKDAGHLYERSAELYVEVGRIYAVMVETGPGDLRTQLDLLARRARELADRVYDRGHAALLPYLDQQQSPDIEVRLPEEVPIWSAEGLGAGPPLDDPQGPADTSPPLRQSSRPTQSAKAWADDVRAAGIPEQAELAQALEHADGDRLGDLGRRFVAAAEQLRGKPDPGGEREKSALLRLGLLIDADAARAGQASTFLESAGRRTLAEVGPALAGIGDDLLRRSRP